MSSNFGDYAIASLVGECTAKGYFGIFTYLNDLILAEAEKSYTSKLSFIMLAFVFLITESVLRSRSLVLLSND